MASVTIQAGHAGWRSRSGRVYPADGGAPGEADWAARLARLIEARLVARGIGVTVVGQWLNLLAPPEASDPVAVLVSLHYDASIYPAGLNTGCFAGRAALDPSGALADALIRTWNSIYPAATGIPLRPERANVVNITNYYAFRDTPAEVPGVLLEHGYGAPPGQDIAVLHGQIERVADADAAAIVAHLMERGLLPTEESEDVGIIQEQAKQIADLEAEIRHLNGVNTTLAAQRDNCESLKQQVEGELRAELERVTRERDTLTKEVALLTAALAAAPTTGRPIHVRVMTEDSQDFDFAPVVGG